MLPASAGMILRSCAFSILLMGAPRIRGDDPHAADDALVLDLCSPHPRG